MTTHAVVIAVVVTLTGCASEVNPLLAELPQSEPVPQRIADACDLARTRCSRCHTTDRILSTRMSRPEDWRSAVHRMRLMPGSAIRTDEEARLVSCFVFRMSGNAGLARLSRETP